MGEGRRSSVRGGAARGAKRLWRQRARLLLERLAGLRAHGGGFAVTFVALCCALCLCAGDEWTIGHEEPWPAPNVAAPQESVFPLDGYWQFVPDPRGELNEQTALRRRGARRIRVPACWEAVFGDLVGYDGVAWYWRTFQAPTHLLSPDKRLFLRFDAVDYLARVWLNGELLGEHEGGYSPFEFEVTGRIRPGHNLVVVRVVDPAGDASRSDGISRAEVPSGKQTHYCNIGGIWQGVRLIARGRAYVHSIFVRPVTGNALVVRTCICGADGAMQVRLTVVETGSGQSVGRATLPARRIVDRRMALGRARVWSPTSPALYRLSAELTRGSEVVDRAWVRFGMRTVEAVGGRVILNGHPIFLAGALDQAFYPRGIYAPAKDDVLARQTALAKRMGLNFLRTHIKIPVPRYLDYADECGLMIWDDFPSWYRWNEHVRRRVERQMYEWVWRDFNRPSVFCWCLINEEWGMDFDDPQVRKWIGRMWRRVKSWDPSRLVVDNSAAGHGHIITDIFDQHVYVAIPERADRFDRWVANYCRRPARSFRYPESHQRGFEPLMVTEFGNWGLPDIGRILRFYGGKKPYWFHQASYGGPIDAGLDAFARWHLSRPYGDLAGLAHATQRHQLDSLKYEIETMRRYPAICGYVITQFTDLNSESNGLLDMCRGEKLVTGALAPVQGSTVIVPRLRRRAYVGGETVTVPVYISYFGPTALVGARLRWRLGPASGAVDVPPLPPASCKLVGNVTAQVPRVYAPEVVRLQLRLQGDDVHARNHLDLWAVPAAAARTRIVKAAECDGDGKVKAALAAIGVAIQNRARVAVVRRLSQERLQWVRDGGRAVLLAEDTSALGPLASCLYLVGRGEKGRWGDWATAFCWLRRDASFRLRLPYDGHMGMPFIDVVPHIVIDGVTPPLMHDAWGGIFVAWMHAPAATALPVRLGEGLLVISTLRLTSAASRGDPVGRVLLADLLDATARQSPKELAAGPLPHLVLATAIVATAEQEAVVWRYTTRDPGAGWSEADFDDSAWKEGEAGFGRAGTPGAIVRTRWHSNDIWLRRKVVLRAPPKAVLMRIHHDEDVEVYINGRLVYKARGFLTAYSNVYLDRNAVAAFRAGVNTIAVHCKQTVGGQYIDVGLWSD